MNKTVLNSTKISLRHISVFAAVLLVLLTSCAVKGSIKSLTGIPAQTEHRIGKNDQSVPQSSLEQCGEIELLDKIIVQKDSFSANDLLPAVIFTTTFLFTFRSVSKEHKHPLYSGSEKIRSSVPIFLEYQKLIIYFA